MKTTLSLILLCFSTFLISQSLYNDGFLSEPGVKIHPTAIIHPSVVLNGDIEIGKYTFIGPGTCIWGKVKIGDYCRIYMNVSIRGHNITIKDHVNIFDQVNIESGRNRAPYFEFPVIEKYAWINHGAVMHGTNVGKKAIVGMGAALNYGCDVGDGAIVMEGSACMVDTKIPENSVAMGVPAKIIQTDIDSSDRQRYIGLNPFEFIEMHAALNEMMHEMRDIARNYVKAHNYPYRENIRDYVYRIGDDDGNVYAVVELVDLNKDKIIVRIHEKDKSIIEVHDPNYGTWTSLAPMLKARQEFPVIAYE